MAKNIFFHKEQKKTVASQIGTHLALSLSLRGLPFIINNL